MTDIKLNDTPEAMVLEGVIYAWEETQERHRLAENFAATSLNRVLQNLHSSAPETIIEKDTIDALYKLVPEIQERINMTPEEEEELYPISAPLELETETFISVLSVVSKATDRSLRCKRDGVTVIVTPNATPEDLLKTYRANWLYKKLPLGLGSK